MENQRLAPGAAGLHVVAGLALLRPKEQVFAAMLTAGAARWQYPHARERLARPRPSSEAIGLIAMLGLGRPAAAGGLNPVAGRLTTLI